MRRPALCSTMEQNSWGWVSGSLESSTTRSGGTEHCMQLPHYMSPMDSTFCLTFIAQCTLVQQSPCCLCISTRSCGMGWTNRLLSSAELCCAFDPPQHTAAYPCTPAGDGVWGCRMWSTCKLDNGKALHLHTLTSLNPSTLVLLQVDPQTEGGAPLSTGTAAAGCSRPPPAPHTLQLPLPPPLPRSLTPLAVPSLLTQQQCTLTVTRTMWQQQRLVWGPLLQHHPGSQMLGRTLLLTCCRRYLPPTSSTPCRSRAHCHHMGPLTLSTWGLPASRHSGSRSRSQV